MDIEELKQACAKFKESEGGFSFYEKAISIVDKYPVQAAIIILATWNRQLFRFIPYAEQYLVELKLKQAIDDCIPNFTKIEDKELLKTNLDEIKDTVKEIYSTLSKVQGVKYTGSAKVMHLINRKLFVMWDRYIREAYGKGTDPEEYVNFLKEVQTKFRNILWNESDKTLAKAIDEYNYVTITVPALEKKKRNASSSSSLLP